jgi:hypothetical protein
LAREAIQNCLRVGVVNKSPLSWLSLSQGALKWDLDLDRELESAGWTARGLVNEA